MYNIYKYVFYPIKKSFTNKLLRPQNYYGRGNRIISYNNIRWN